MTDLHDKVRALLALRDKATPGPWHAGDDSRYVWATGTNLCVNSTGYDGETLTAGDAQFIAAAHDMADTIRDLLAENERVAAMLRWETAGRIHDCARAEAAEARYAALCEAEPVAFAMLGLDAGRTYVRELINPWEHPNNRYTHALIPRPVKEVPCG